MPKRSHLVPKSIVDSRGRNTTVYVKDGQAAPGRASALKRTPVISGPNQDAIRLPGSGPKEQWRANDYIYEASRIQAELIARIDEGDDVIWPLVNQRNEANKRRFDALEAGSPPTDDSGPVAVIDESFDSEFLEGDTRIGFSNDFGEKDAERDAIMEVSDRISRLWLGSCSSAEAIALATYGSASEKYALEHVKGELSEGWQHFEAAVERSPEIDPFVTYSGVNYHYVNDMLQQAETGVIEFGRVFSSSLNPAQVNGFATEFNFADGEMHRSAKLALEVETTKAACMTVPAVAHEMEVLLPKGRYEVLEILENITYLWGEGEAGRTMDKVIRLRRIED